MYVRTMDLYELPRRWVSPASDVWGRTGPGEPMYRAIPYEALPALSRPSSEPFAWLRGCPVRGGREQLKIGLIDDEGELLPVKPAVDAIVARARAEGLSVPASYVTFMNDASLHQRIPTCTACYLDVPTKLVALPCGAPGKLLRFLNDQQCCMHWFLLLTPDGACSVACATPTDDDADADADDGDSIDDMKLEEVTICAPSFEDLVHRFWMENMLWFSLYKQPQAPLTPEQQGYLDAVKKASRAAHVGDA